MSGPKKDKFGRNGENFIIIVFMICPNYQILLEWAGYMVLV